MNKKLEAFKESISGKRIIVLGVGISNKPLIKMLLSFGANVTACDKNEELSADLLQLMKLGARFNLGEKYLDDLDGDIIFKTPGMRSDIPELLEAKQKGIKITSEMELFFELCPCKIIGVTGSDGKTTTTTLIYNMLCEEGYTCHLGGNIGEPLLPKIENMEKSDYVVAELSSFQLHTMKKSPNIAVVTNMSPNHLDVHKSMDEYIEAKKNIFKYQTKTGKLILNADNDITASFAQEAKGEVIPFSMKSSQTDGVYIDEENNICFGENKIINANEIAIPGMHNVENYMTAIAAVAKLVSVTSIRAVARNFKGVEHRIEYVREVDGVKFYNDSIASSPTRARAGLYSFKQKVILIAGGYDKHIPFDEFGEDIKARCKRVYLIGATAPLIKEAIIKAYEGKRTLPVIQYPTLERAVKEAYMAAEAGDVVILSPACASFDMYKNFEERGKRYKEIVRSL